MGIARRLALLFRMKADKALDRAEDPREVLDYSYERQLEMLTKVRRGVADVVTSRKRLELQLGQLRQAADRLQTQARQAVDAGRDDLAREALTRRSAALTQMAAIAAQRDALQAEEDKLTLAAQRLQARVEAFRSRKETIRATYTAAEARTRIGEAVSGISEEMGDVGLAMQRAEDKTVQMQSRAAALDELIASGALDDATLPAGQRDDIQAALDAARGDADIEHQLTALKTQPALTAQPAPADNDPDAPRTITGTRSTEEGKP
ncbi:phage shock protein A [Carbonactinospora thermoautotrophica]|uniref:PspA/IM30 family protein n=1 Tax=Carbonactinospora thermoautotrophica TaxID=1469144 RepID=UPI00226FAF45|nr:PspA/IM30 family protein [Carbonactinospora thermoautotrophica]MCX9192337.1 phage shock protein A [Carbonactinospora thermoautotrophica]